MGRGIMSLGLAAWLAALTAAFAPAALAQDKQIQLKLSHWVPPAHPLQAALEEAENG